MMIINFDDKKLITDGDDFWIAPNATVIGDVHLLKDASIWFNAVVRGDNEPITVGQGSNVQDGAIIHTDPGFPCTIGKNVTIHPNVTILADVNIGDNCVIHSGSVLGTAFVNKRTSKGINQFFHDGKLIVKKNVEILTNCSLDKGNSLNGL